MGKPRQVGLAERMRRERNRLGQLEDMLVRAERWARRARQMVEQCKSKLLLLQQGIVPADDDEEEQKKHSNEG